MAEAVKKIRVTLVKSIIKQTPKQIAVVRALGLKKTNSSVEHEATPSIVGMVNAVSHLLKVEELN